MFSPTIQGYINEGGKEAAIKRAKQLQSHALSLEKQINPEKTAEKTTFADMLKASRGGISAFRLQNDKQTTPAASVSKTSATNSISLGENPSRVQLLNMISKISKKYGVDEKLVQAVIKQESGFNPKAVSHCGAQGLMQLMPATAKGLGVKDAFNPVQNVDGGVRHLKGLLARYNGNLILALAAYNAGGGNVDKYGGVPPFKETQNYVRSILANYLS